MTISEKIRNEQEQSSMMHNHCVTPGQERLVRVLGAIVENWDDQETAKTVEINFGLLRQLRHLKPGETVIMTVSGPGEFQLEVKRLLQPVLPTGPQICTWYPFPPPGHWVCNAPIG